MDGTTFPSFPIPLPVIMQDEKDYAEAEAWKQYQEESLQLQEAALEQQIEYNQKGDIFAMNQIDLLGDIADKPAIKQNKEKQVKIWDKILKNKTFEGIWKGIKGIASSLSSGFMDMILGLMVWAFLDPDGSLMISLINIFVSLSVMVIRLFARMIPVVLKMIIKVLPVILKAIMTIIDTVIDVLPQIIDAVIELLPVIWNMLITQVPVIIGKLMDAVVLILHKIGDHFPMLKPLLDLIERFAISIKDLFDPSSKDSVKQRIWEFTKTLVGIMWDSFIQQLKMQNKIIDTIGSFLIEMLVDGFKIGLSWFADLFIGIWNKFLGTKLAFEVMKLKKKLEPTIKWIMDKLNQFINSIADGFKNLKNVSIGDILYNAFNSALHGIPELLRKYFSNIPGADTLRKGFEALEKWFKSSIFYAGLEKAGLVGGNKKNEPVVFNQDLFSKFSPGLNILSEDVRNKRAAKALLEESGVSAESLKHILMGGKVSDLNLDNEKQQKLTEAIKGLEKSFGGADKFKQEVSQNIADNKDVLKVLEKIASKKEFQSVIGSMGNATMKNTTGN